MRLVLHNFFRSSTSTRLRAALNLKGIAYDYVPYALRNGETRTPQYLAKNPQGLVPMLEREDGSVLTQSLAIIEWLDETHPAPPLLPPLGKNNIRSAGSDVGRQRSDWPFLPWRRPRICRFVSLRAGLEQPAVRHQDGRLAHAHPNFRRPRYAARLSQRRAATTTRRRLIRQHGGLCHERRT